MELMKIHQVSKLTGVSVRTLRYYDRIGLLPPTQVTEAGYRLYDEAALYRLQVILLFRELEFPLREIGAMIDGSTSRRNEALAQQITLLEMKREHLDNLIDLARGLIGLGVKKLDFTAFDTKKIDEYARQAKENWGQSDEYREYERKSAGRTADENRALGEDMMRILGVFGTMKHLPPSDEAVQRQVKHLQDFITEHFYTCSDGILQSLGNMYGGGGSFTEGIDKTCGAGTAAFVSEAIDYYCANRQ